MRRFKTTFLVSVFILLLLPLVMGGMAYGDGSVSGTVSYMGDINGDGNVDISDVILVLRCALGLSINYQCQPCGNINGAAQIDISDVILTLRMALGLDSLRQCI